MLSMAEAREANGDVEASMQIIYEYIYCIIVFIDLLRTDLGFFFFFFLFLFCLFPVSFFSRHYHFLRDFG